MARQDPTTQDFMEEESDQESWERFVDWQEDIKRRGELKEKRVRMKERTVGKEIYSVGETVRLQNIKTKKWDVWCCNRYSDCRRQHNPLL